MGTAYGRKLVNVLKSVLKIPRRDFKRSQQKWCKHWNEVTQAKMLTLTGYSTSNRNNLLSMLGFLSYP